MPTNPILPFSKRKINNEHTDGAQPNGDPIATPPDMPARLGRIYQMALYAAQRANKPKHRRITDALARDGLTVEHNGEFRLFVRPGAK